jgi:carbamoyl-phosphate synthase large subunit
MSVIAITGTGSLFGQAIIKSIKNSSFKNSTLIGMDYFKNTVGSNWVDKNFILPDLLDASITESVWLESVQSIIKNNDVEILFVGVDFELPLFAKYKNKIERITSCLVIVSDEKTIEIADDKYLTYEFLKDNNFNYPLSFLESEIDEAIEASLIHFPMIIKPRKGYRSVDVNIVHDKLNLNQKIRSTKNPIIQEYIGSDDTEFTCGVIAFNGDVKKSIVLQRTLKNGNTHTTSLRANFPSAIKDYIELVSSKLNQFGVCNYQLRMDHGLPKIFEINARHSGTTYIRSLYGFNEVEYILELMLNEKEIDFEVKEGKVQRYFDEFFIGLEE